MVAKEGVKVAGTAIVAPAALVVVYVYGVGAPAVPVVPAGCPTGPTGGVAAAAVVTVWLLAVS